MRHILQLFWGLSLCLFTIGTASGQPWVEEDKIVASNRSAGASFGHYHASGMWDNIAVVGAPLGENNNGQQTGAAYVYERDPLTCEWIEVQMLIASDATPFDAFGQAVAINDRFIAVGAPYESHDAAGLNFMSDAGAVYLFEYDNNNSAWIEVAKVVASDREAMGRFGIDVDLYENGVVIGADLETFDTQNPASQYAGAAYVFRETMQGVWTEEQKLLASDRDDNDRFGHAVAIYGRFLVVGSADEHDVNGLNPLSGAGAAYIFEWQVNSWVQIQKITPTAADRQNSEYFSRSIDIEGDVIVAAATYDILDENLQAPLNTAGSVFIFRRDNLGTWLIEDKVDAADRDFGDQLGASVAIYGNRIAVGAEQDDQPGPIYNTGSLYLFEYDGIGAWNEVDKQLSSDYELADRLGVSIAMYDDHVLVGAFKEDEDDASIPGNSLSDAGSAYIFHLPTSADQPIVAIPAPVCSGQPVNLSIIAGNLNDNTDWTWYANSCGGTVVGTGMTITVSPTSTTTYYVQGTGGCVADGPCGSVTVMPAIGNFWHQSTKNTLRTEIHNDVVTDAAGNVYVTGTFWDQTTLDGGMNPDVIINALNPDSPCSFTACYNPCGDLVWAAEAQNSRDNEGFSIVMDEINQLVYVTGYMISTLNYNTSNICGTGFATIGTPGLWTKGYVAAFEASTGCLHFLEEVDLATFTSCKALAIDESNGDLFVGGTISPANLGANSSAFLRHYSPTATNLGPALGAVNSTSTGTSEVNDLDYDESNELLWAIGTFEDQVAFAPGNTLTVQTGNVIQDAFVLAYENNGGLNPVINNRGNTSADMSGHGIAVDPQDGSVYLTGQYLNAINLPFEFTTVGSLTNGNVPRAYMVKYDMAGGNSWSRFGRVPGGMAIGRAVTVGGNGQVFFVGGYACGSGSSTLVLQTPGFLNLLIPYVSNPANGSNEHLYVTSYTPDGQALWGNATTDPTNDNAVHEGMAIALSGQSAFIAGRYLNNMDYLVSMGTGAPLNSTGLDYNAFILNVDLQTASFLRPAEDEGDVDVDELKEDSRGKTNDQTINAAKVAAINELVVHPNPTNDLLHIVLSNDWEDEPSRLQLLDLQGREVRNVTVTQSTSTLSLKDLPQGVYLLRYQSATASTTVRVIKQ